MKKVILHKLFFGLGLISTVVSAQQVETLLIGSGDMLHVQVFDTPELDQHVRVTDAGEISLLVGGSVKVVGKTPAVAAQGIEQALRQGNFLRYPHVAVVVEEYATQKVSVLGEVKQPGAYAISTAQSVLDVLALAGGLTENADRKVWIERMGSKEKLPYFVSNHAGKAMDTAVTLHPGDVLMVPKAGIIYVLGDVQRPGGYMMNNNDAQITVLEAIARAGGTNNSAVPSHARLIHRTENGYQNLPLPLNTMQKGKHEDLVMLPDDIIYVPFSYMRNLAINASGLAASVGSATIYKF